MGASGRATALKAFNGSDTDWASFGHFMGPFDAEALLGAAFLAPSPANGAHAPCVLVVDGNGIRICGSAEALGITLPYRELASVEIVPNSSPTRPRYLRGPRSDDHCYLRTRDGRYGLFAGSTTGLSDHLRSVGATVLNAGGRGMPRWHGDGLPDGPPAGASHTI